MNGISLERDKGPTYFKKNKQIYLNLCQKFLDSKIDSVEFGEKFYQQYKKDNVLDISNDDFEDKESSYSKVLNMVSSVYIGIDSCSDDDDNGGNVLRRN